MSVGERITQLRKQYHISQAELSRIMNISRQAVSKWENDLSEPDTLNLIKLADALNTDVEYLATGKSSLSPSHPEPEKVIEYVEKIVEVEKPVYVQKIVEVEKPVEVIVEKPVIRKIIRIKYLRNPFEFALIGVVCLIIGVIIGLLF